MKRQSNRLQNKTASGIRVCLLLFLKGAKRKVKQLDEQFTINLL